MSPAETDRDEDTAIEPVASARARVVDLDGAIVSDGLRVVAVEVPVQIFFADIPFAVMMLTPVDLVDFAYGFSLTEGIVENAGEIRDVSIAKADDGMTLRISLVGDKLHKHLARQRAMTGRTGCGVCGINDLEALRRAQLKDSVPGTVSVASIKRALRALDGRQTLNLETRAVHGAAWADASGDLIEVREDVGRHNALDKLIGSRLRAGTDPSSGFVLITSRCSFEMVEKSATFGAHTLVAISAPTSLAIERAEALDLTLIAIARHDTMTAFTNPDRLRSNG